MIYLPFKLLQMKEELCCVENLHFDFCYLSFQGYCNLDIYLMLLSSPIGMFF